jgi:hypothetical protein
MHAYLHAYVCIFNVNGMKRSFLILAMQSWLHSLGEQWLPILRESKFRETGRLTPEEVHLCQ